RMFTGAGVQEGQLRLTDGQTARYTGRREACSEQRVAGWISNQNAQSSPVVLDLASMAELLRHSRRTSSARSMSATIKVSAECVETVLSSQFRLESLPEGC
ncbi:MAG: hypothetical protein ABFS02_12590, partial [Pseudomonadota bacterium]